MTTNKIMGSGLALVTYGTSQDLIVGGLMFFLGDLVILMGSSDSNGYPKYMIL